MQPLTRLLLLLTLGLGFACGGGRSEDYCADNADCETRLTCFQNRCLQLEQVPEGLVWEVLPAGHERPAILETPQRIQPLPFRVCASSVEGTTGELGPMRVDIEGEPRGLPGRCAFDQARVEGAFSIPLSPGTWRLTFHPEAGPPIVRRVEELRRCETFPLGTLQPPLRSTLRVLPTTGEADPGPRCGIRLRAFDPEQGGVLSEALDIRLDAEGACEPPHPEGWPLEVARPKGRRFALLLESTTAAAPVMRQRVVHVEWKREAMEPLVVSVEAQAAERTLLDLVDPDGLPVAGARIRASWPWPEAASTCLGREPGPPSEFGAFRSAPAMPTEVPGTYELWLPPGPYHFEVVPPAATDLAAKIWEEPTTIRAGGGNALPLRLSRKSVLEGVVRAEPTRELVGQTRIFALPLAPLQRAKEAHTDAQGFFRLPVDPGPYLLLADPPGRGRAREWSFLEVGEAEEVRADFALSPPRVLAGQVGREGEEAPLGYTLVRAWDVTDERPVLAGEAVTDASGRFVLRLRR